MDKRILQEYIDACELIKETESDIKKLRKKKNVPQKYLNPKKKKEVQKQSWKQENSST